MPEKAKPKLINRVYVLVHPFYSIVNQHEQLQIPDALTDARIKKSISFLFGLWGKTINEAMNDPNSILIFVEAKQGLLRQFETHANRETNQEFYRWFLPKYARFKAHASRMGNRSFFVENSTIEIGLRLPQLFQERGLVFRRKTLRGISFGEYAKWCVKDEAALTEGIFGLRKQKVVVSEYLSLDSPMDYDTLIGRLRPNLKRKARKIFRKLQNGPANRPKLK